MIGHMEWQSKHSNNYISKAAHVTCDSEAFFPVREQKVFHEPFKHK